MKRVVVCGCTGSIGQSTLKIAAHLKDEIEIVALVSYGNNLDLLNKQILEFSPKIVALFDEKKAGELRDRGIPTPVVGGMAAIKEVVQRSDVDFVMMAIGGLIGLEPTLAAIEKGKIIGLANKEVIVAGGSLVMEQARKYGATILPVDSEHSAIFQCLQGHDKNTVSRIVLTASGGPFYNYASEDLEKVNVAQALAHPTWKMGPKVTIDSSTMMNKGLEIIEAYWLFGLKWEQIDVVIHPQSIIHSMVEFIDGSMLAQMSQPLMTYPIQYALTFPKRREGIEKPFDFVKNNKLEFYIPNTKKFRSLSLAYQALKEGGSLPCYLNAANEVLVDRFICGEISWLSIIDKLETLLSRHKKEGIEMENLFLIDRNARREAKSI
jgi:1-deoxy-D-xylulose-5-phosphate reductoisomerase